MKKLVLASIVIGVSATSSFAADLPSRNAPAVYAPPAAPIFTWTGFYAGLNAGYAFNGNHTYNTVGNNPGIANTMGGISLGIRPGYFRDSADGFTGGGQIGYNYQFGGSAVVVGVEADAAYTDLQSTGSYQSLAIVSRVSNFRANTDFIGTVRGRLGYAFNNILVYGTGGFAYGGVSDDIAFHGLGANNFGGSSDTLRAGYAFGGGVEYAIPTSSFLNVFNAGAVTLRAEFIHYDLGSSTLLLTNLAGSSNTYTTRVNVDGNLVRAGINYKFGSPAPAVVAKY